MVSQIVGRLSEEEKTRLYVLYVCRAGDVYAELKKLGVTKMIEQIAVLNYIGRNFEPEKTLLDNVVSQISHENRLETEKRLRKVFWNKVFLTLLSAIVVVGLYLFFFVR